jgi:hypothetical protein
MKTIMPHRIEKIIKETKKMIQEKGITDLVTFLEIE